MTKTSPDKDEGERSSAPSPLPPIADTEKAAAKIAGTGLLLILVAFAAFVGLLFFLVGRL